MVDIGQKLPTYDLSQLTVPKMKRYAELAADVKQQSLENVKDALAPIIPFSFFFVFLYLFY